MRRTRKKTKVDLQDADAEMTAAWFEEARKSNDDAAAFWASSERAIKIAENQEDCREELPEKWVLT